MNELQIVLQGISEEDRQTLAHELLTVLEGRRTASADGRERDPGEDQALKSRDTFEPMNIGTSEKPSPAESGIERKRGTEWAQQIEEPGDSRLLPEKTEQRSHTAVRSGEEARFTVLRRTVPGTKTMAETELHPSFAEENSQLTAYRQMREISEYFRQDSRRYDAGFTRY